MTNAKLKTTIENAAGVKIRSTTYKSGDAYEGYSRAYPADAPSFVAKGKTYYRGATIAEGNYYSARTAMSATTKSLLRLAELLGVAIETDPSVAREQADFDARTK